MRKSTYAAACIATSIALCIVPCIASAKKRVNRVSAGKFDYFLLVLSYAPDFCAQPTGQKDPLECGKGRKIGFVVHGLWPQLEAGKGPEDCVGSPVSSSLVQQMLPYIPTASLIQHEWKTHGTCTGSSATDYFAEVRKARDGVMVPGDLSAPSGQLSLSPASIEAKFQAANSSYPTGTFRTSCYSDGELQEIRVCFQKNLTPRACPVSAQECTRSTVNVLPVR